MLGVGNCVCGCVSFLQLLLTALTDPSVTSEIGSDLGHILQVQALKAPESIGAGDRGKRLCVYCEVFYMTFCRAQSVKITTV